MTCRYQVGALNWQAVTKAPTIAPNRRLIIAQTSDQRPSRPTSGPVRGGGASWRWVLGASEPGARPSRRLALRRRRVAGRDVRPPSVDSWIKLSTIRSNQHHHHRSTWSPWYASFCFCQTHSKFFNRMTH